MLLSCHSPHSPRSGLLTDFGRPVRQIPTTALRARWLPPTKFYGIRFRHQNSRTRTRFFFFFFFCQGRPERKSVHRRLYPRRGGKCAHNPQWANEPLEQQRTLLCWADIKVLEQVAGQSGGSLGEGNLLGAGRDRRALLQRLLLPTRRTRTTAHTNVGAGYVGLSGPLVNAVRHMAAGQASPEVRHTCAGGRAVGDLLGFAEVVRVAVERAYRCGGPGRAPRG